MHMPEFRWCQIQTIAIRVIFTMPTTPVAVVIRHSTSARDPRRPSTTIDAGTNASVTFLSLALLTSFAADQIDSQRSTHTSAETVPPGASAGSEPGSDHCTIQPVSSSGSLAAGGPTGKSASA